MDIDAMLAALDSGEGGVGEDLRLDISPSSPYQRLRDARSNARAEERARDADGDADAPDAASWRDVLEIAEEALTTKSKDLEIAAWLTEAMVRRHGFEGLAAGARLLAGLCETYWEHVFPRPDEDGLEGRSSPIEGLSGASADGTVMQTLRRLPLFRRTDGSPVALYQWDQAEQVATLDEERRAARIAAGALDLRTLEVEARANRDFLRGNGRAIQGLVADWQTLESTLDKHFGEAAPSLRKVRTLLERLLEVMGRLGGLDSDEAEHPSAGDDAAPSQDGGGGAGGLGAAGGLTRESALRDLDRIADYFRRTEPHSPLAYTLEEAVRRGRMTLPELLAEVVPDAEARNAMLMRLGIKPDAE